MKRFSIRKLTLLLFLLALVTLLILIRRPKSEVDRNYAVVNSSSQTLLRRLPQAIIIGAAKCGTSALRDFFGTHPQVAAADGEINFFTFNFYRGLEWYRQQMPPSREDQLTIEKSPTYFGRDWSPAPMSCMNSSARLVVILCEPVTRVVSHYGLYLMIHEDYKTLEELIIDSQGKLNPKATIMRSSMYETVLRKFLQFFSASQIHLVDGDAFRMRPHEELQRLEAFFNLKPYFTPQHFVFNATKGFYCVRRTNESGSQRCLGSDKGRRHPSVSPQTLEKLRRFFTPLMDDSLAQLVGRRFLWMERRNSTGRVE